MPHSLGPMDESEDIATKQYVDTQRDTRVAKTGDTMSGDLTVASYLITLDSAGTAAMILDRGTPSNFAQFEFRTAGMQDLAVGLNNAGKFHFYVPSGDKTALSLDPATGLTTVYADPTAALGVATKQYVDNKPSGGPDEVTIATGQPATPTDLWVDTDEPGGTGTDYVLKSGDKMTGTLDVPTITSTVDDIRLGTHINAQNNTIWGLRNPPTGGDWAVTKDYVDTWQVLDYLAYTAPWTAAASVSSQITKHGGMVTIEMGLKPTTDTAVSATASTYFGTIPVGMRPASNVNTAGVLMTATNVYYPCVVWAEPAGSLKMRAFQSLTVTAASGVVSINLTYRQAA